MNHRLRVILAYISMPWVAASLMSAVAASDMLPIKGVTWWGAYRVNFGTFVGFAYLFSWIVLIPYNALIRSLQLNRIYSLVGIGAVGGLIFGLLTRYPEEPTFLVPLYLVTGGMACAYFSFVAGWQIDPNKAQGPTT